MVERLAVGLDLARRELRVGVRRLLGRPGFTLVAAITLGLGIGATTAMFSVVRGVLLEPLPYQEPDRLVGLWHTGAGLGREEMHVSTGLYFTYLEENRVFEQVGLWDEAEVTVTGLESPERVDALVVSQSVLPLLGARPVAGHLFTASDDASDAPLTVVLSHGYWQRHFGGEASAVGQTLTVNGGEMEIVGVLPRSFNFPTMQADLYFPFRLDRSEAMVGRFNYQALARLRPGVTLEGAQADLERMLPMSVDKFPTEAWNRDRLRELALAPVVRPLKQDVVGDISTALWLVFGAVGLVLLIACANVANLLLIRAAGRRREVAVRTALGAGRAAVIREFLIEALVLGAIGGGVGVGLAFAALGLLSTMAPDALPLMERVGLDAGALGFAVAVSVLAVLAAVLLPVIQHSRPGDAGALRERVQYSAAGSGRSRDALAVAQVTLAFFLLIASGLMIRSFRALRAVDPGVENPGEVIVFGLFIPGSEVPDDRRAARTQQEILTQIEALPEVVSASIGSSVPMYGSRNNNSVYVEDFPVPEGVGAPSRRLVFVAPGYFETLGIPMLAGRAFDWRDVHQLRTAAVVTENFAREYWGAPGEAVGKRVREGAEGPWKEVIGVVGNVHDDGLSREATPVLYWPILVADFWGMEFFGYFGRSTTYAIRTAGPPTAALPAIRRAVWSVNPRLPLADVRTLQDVVDGSMARTSFTVVLLALAAAIALFLEVVGLYGVVAFSVSTRTREIGIRMAVGAATRDVTAMILGRGFALAGVGVAGGVLGALVVSRLMRTLLFGVAPVDPVTYVATAAILVVVTALASYVPARRAAAVEPMRVLKDY